MCDQCLHVGSRFHSIVPLPNPIISQSILFAIYFFHDELVFPCLMHHALTVDDLGGGIKISLHKENRLQLSDECASKHFLKHY